MLQSTGLQKVRHDLVTEHHHHHQCLMTRSRQTLTGMASLGLFITLYVCAGTYLHMYLAIKM